MTNDHPAQSDKHDEQVPLTNPVRVWHLLMILLCLAAWFTGELAGDYKKIEHTGFLIHRSLGLLVFLSLGFYIIYGLVGPKACRLSGWFPLTGERLRRTGQDLAVLRKFKLPEHKRRQGLAGMVQFFGILVFSWLALSGTVMALSITPGIRAGGILHSLMEAHEAGAVLIPVYLLLHVGAVIAHSLQGDHVWKEIFFMRKGSAVQPDPE
ncbi:MAG: cytochrome b/b6 domain-containing protein [Candidatus Electrothrix sp. YB6]